MGKIYLHIGTHKTGSTFVQKSFAKNYEVLKRNGYLYPMTARVSQGSHHNLQFQITNDKRFKEEKGGWGQLFDEVDSSGCKNVVLSCEAFSTLQGGDLIPRAIKKIADDRGFDVDVFCYLRPQHELIESLWLQETKAGQNILCFSDYVNYQITRPRFDYFKLYKEWSSFFNCNFYGYNEVVKSPGIYQHLIEEIGYQGEALSFLEGKENKRISVEFTEFIRCISLALKGRGFSKVDREMVSYKIRKAIDKDFGSCFNVIDKEDASKIFNFYKKSNESLSKKNPNLQGLLRLPRINGCQDNYSDNIREEFFNELVAKVFIDIL